MSRIEDPGSSRQFRTEFCVCECEWEHQGDARLREGGFFSCIAWRIHRKKTNNWGTFCLFRLKMIHLIRCIPHSFEAEQTGSTRLTPGQRRGRVPGRGEPQTNNYRADTGARRGPGLAFVNYDIYLMSDHSQWTSAIISFITIFFTRNAIYQKTLHWGQIDENWK